MRSRKDIAEMAEPMRALLSRLEARLAAQEAELAAYRAERAAARRRPRRRHHLIAAIAAAILVALVPLALLAAGPFTDLDPNSPHNGNIAAIQAAGITKGCDPPDFTQYCPKDNVTREEMASFLARTAGLGGNPPVVNALTAQTATSAGHAATADSATSATNATNASNTAQLGGVPASGYLRPVGDLVYQISPLGLVDLNDQIAVSVAIQPLSYGGVSIRSDPAGTRYVALPLPVPGAIFGTTVGIAKVSVCFSTDAGAKIDATELGETTTGSYVQDFYDTTDHAGASDTCYTVSSAPVYAVTGDPFLKFTLAFANNTAKVYLKRITVTLKPA
jgi:hypothetical protein